MKAAHWLLVSCLALVVLGYPDPITVTKDFSPGMRDIQYLNHQVILVVQRNGGLQISRDAGKTWAEKALPKGSGSAGVNDIHISHRDGTIFLHGTGRTNWWSRDEGQTFYEDAAPAQFNVLDWHYNQSGYLLGVNQPSYSAYITRDYGKSYKKVSKTILEADWGDAGRKYVNKERIYMVDTKDWADFDLVYTENDGATHPVLQSNIFAARFLEHQIFTLSYADNWNDIYLRVTPDIGYEKKVFYRAEFPWGEELEQKNLYAILDDHTRAVFMAINHGNSDSRWGHLYVSDPMGIQYVLSLPHILHTNTEFDFMRVLGTRGVYIANSLENYSDGKNVPEQVRTYITYNGGASWVGLKPPAVDFDKKPYRCTGTCTLHLHGWRSYVSGAESKFGPFYSAWSALDLIVGNGNVGDSLTNDPSQAAVFLSNDGGNSFREIGKGAAIYEIADHGGIVVWANINEPTDTIYYTLDFGKSTESFKISKKIRVWNIISESQLNGTSFMVLDNQYATVVHLDFTAAFNNKVCGPSDYEAYSPRNPYSKNVEGLHCLMGTQMTYSRRKESVICHSPPNYHETKVIKHEFCKCTETDFECDYGYINTGTSVDGAIRCERDESIKLHDPPLWCKPGRVYNVSRGYRLEAGNDCKDGLADERLPQTKTCPKTAIEDEETTPTTPDKPEGSSSRAGWIAVGVMVPIILLIVAAAFFALNNEKIRDKIPFLSALRNQSDGYSRMGQPGGAPGALFDDEEYIIGPLDDKHDDDEGPDGLKTVDLHSKDPAGGADLEFDPPHR